LDKWHLVLETNVTGAFLMCRAAGRRMIERGQGGRVINVSSVTGLLGTYPDVMDAIGYSASKASLIGLTRDLAVKWAGHGMLVNAIAPSFFPTRMSQAWLDGHQPHVVGQTPLGRLGRPGEIKGVVVFLAAEASSYITGQVIAIDGGMSAA